MKAKTAVQDYDLSLEDECLPDATLSQVSRDFFVSSASGGAPRLTLSATITPSKFIGVPWRVVLEAPCSHRKPERHSTRTEVAHLFKSVLFIFV